MKKRLNIMYQPLYSDQNIFRIPILDLLSIMRVSMDVIKRMESLYPPFNSKIFRNDGLK